MKLHAAPAFTPQPPAQFGQSQNVKVLPASSKENVDVVSLRQPKFGNDLVSPCDWFKD
jgi:hypothetical protein